MKIRQLITAQIGRSLFVVILGVGYLVVFAHRFLPSVAALDIGSDIGADHAVLGAIGAVYLYVYGLLQGPSGFLTDKFGARKVLVASFILTGVGTVWFAFASSSTEAVLSRIMVGAGCAPVLVAAMVFLAGTVPDKKFAFYSSCVYVIGGLGPLFASFPLAYANAEMGWRGAALAAGILTMIYAPVFLLLPIIKGNEQRDNKTAKRVSFVSTVITVFSERKLWPFLILAFGVPSIYIVYGGLWGVPYLRQVYGYSEIEAAWAVSFGAMGAIAGFLAGPALSGGGAGSRLKVIAAFAFLTFCCLVPIVAGISLSYPALCAQAFFIGCFSAGVQPVAMAALKDVFPPDFVGTVLGIYNAFPFIGSGLLQLVIGVILTRSSGMPTESYGMAFVPAAVMCLAGFAAIAVGNFTVAEKISD